MARENEQAAEIAADLDFQMIDRHVPIQRNFSSLISLSLFLFLIIIFIKMVFFFNFNHSVDPCAKIHCGAGRVCQAEGDSAACVCIPECPEQTDPRRKVCSNKNDTWSSDCDVHRERCLCDTGDARCKSAELKHIHINYYGECKEIPVNTIQTLIMAT